MRIADYIFDFFYKKGITTVFQLVGGGSMYLNDAVSKSKMDVYDCHHEQACAYSAIGYTKYSEIPSIVLVTTGCGATNTITGLLDAYQDSVPLIFISGQVRSKDINYNLRQSGVQGADLIPIVKHRCKDAVCLPISNFETYTKLLSDMYDECMGGGAKDRF